MKKVYFVNNRLSDYDMNILKSVYDIDKNQPTQVDFFEVSCISEIPNFYNFELLVNEKSSYLTSILPLGDLGLLWHFLENIVINKFPVLICFELEGPKQLLFASKTSNNEFIRIIFVSNSWFCPIKNEVENTIEMKQMFSTSGYTVHLDILINKKQFILEFYKELFSMFYGKQLPDFDAVGQNVITESQILREYFKELSDENLLSLKNKKSKNYLKIKIP